MNLLKHIKLFYLKNCPYCIKTLTHLRELLDNHEVYKSIDIRYIEESVEKELADSFDYYYVPTIYLDDLKVLEGKFSKESLRKVLEECLEDKVNV